MERWHRNPAESANFPVLINKVASPKRRSRLWKACRFAAGPIATWAEEIARSAESSEKPKRRVKGRGDPTLSDRSLPLNPSGVKKAQTGRLPPEEKPMKTARGTSMGGKATARERAGAGLMPVAGLDVTLEHAKSFPQGAVTATVQALSDLIEKGRPEFRDHTWVPHRPPRPEKSEGGIAPDRREFEPKGDQPTAIAELVAGVKRSTSATRCCSASPARARPSPWRKVIEATQRPALILAPNKTLAAQLYGEFKSFFPDNAVEYFVSYYDYYQPEAYVPRTDTYIEKESSINEQIDRMRHAATRSLLERDDVIIVASVSCIYGIGSVETYTAMTFAAAGRRARRPAPAAGRPRRAAVPAHRRELRARHLPRARRHASSCSRRTWRTAPGASPCSATRSSAITEFDPLTGQKTDELKLVKIYANSHYVTPQADAAAGDQGHQGRAQAAPRRAGQRAGACWRRSGSSSAPCSTWR